MRPRSVDWAALRDRDEHGGAEGLRERKKRLLRQRLTDTATEMFLDRGFDAVTIVEVAAACDVSEKTVYNYFPTKESLILDRWEGTVAPIRAALADTGMSPVDAVLRILADELGALTAWLRAQPDLADASASVRRFGELIASTPALRSYQSDTLSGLTIVAAQALAGRYCLSPDDPQPQIAAIALLGLWQIQFRALGKHLDRTATPDQVENAVSGEVERAGQLIAAGLRTLGAESLGRSAATAPA
jgi:AcrR family transcriptional regulator